MTSAFFRKVRRIVAHFEYREFICSGKCSPRVSIVPLYTVGQISHLEMSWEFVLHPVSPRTSERALGGFAKCRCEIFVKYFGFLDISR